MAGWEGGVEQVLERVVDDIRCVSTFVRMVVPSFVEQGGDNGAMAILYMEFYSEVFLTKNHNTHRGTHLWIVKE